MLCAAVMELSSASFCRNTVYHYIFLLRLINILLLLNTYGPNSVVGVATRYWLDDPGFKTWRWRQFPYSARLALKPAVQ
jgi:hypothetical protein